MLYRIAKTIVKPLMYLLYRPNITGIDNIPKEGKTIVYSNHISMLDPVLIGCILPRRVYFMAKEELFKNPLLRWLLTNLGAFKVKRGSADISAVKNALKVLKEDKVFGIFPEGTRNAELGEFSHGIAAISHRSKAVTVPVVIVDKYRLFRPTRVVIGKPLELDEYYSQKSNAVIMDEISGKMLNTIKNIFDEYNK